MRTFAIGAILSALGAAGQQVNATGGLTTILAMAASGGVLTLFVQKYLSRKQDGASLADEAMEAIKKSLASVKIMRAELDAIYGELARVQQDLHQANEQITALQTKLENANGDRERLTAELKQSVEARAALQAQLTALTTRMAELEAIYGDH